MCRELGVGAGQVPALADVEEGRGGPAVCACVWAVAERAAALGLPVRMTSQRNGALCSCSVWHLNLGAWWACLSAQPCRAAPKSMCWLLAATMHLVANRVQSPLHHPSCSLPPSIPLQVPHFGGADWHAGMPREMAVKRVRWAGRQALDCLVLID